MKNNLLAISVCSVYYYPFSRKIDMIVKAFFFFFLLKTCSCVVWVWLPTDKQGRPQTQSNGVVNHVAQIVGLRVFADHTCKNKCKTNASMIFLCRVYFHAQTAVDAGDICTWRTTVILLMEKPEDPQFEPHAGAKIAQVLCDYFSKGEYYYLKSIQRLIYAANRS